MTDVLLVGIGGLIGSVSRHLLSLFLTGSLTSYIHFPTVVINLVGSFLMGVLLAVGQVRLGAAWYHFLIPGLLGGFTTYSAFSGEALTLLRSELYLSALMYIFITLIGGLVMVAFGFLMSKYMYQ